MKILVISRFELLRFWLIPAPLYPAPFHLVVATPQRKAGPVAQTANVLHRFDTQIFDKRFLIQRVNATRKDKILPYQNTIAVTEVIKSFLLKKAAAPHTQHILVRFSRACNQPFQRFITEPGGE